MNREKRYQANPIVSCGEEEDGAILYNPDSDNTSIVNLTGREIWTYLEAPHTTKEIIEHLVQNYSGVSVDQVSEDIELFIDTLLPDFLLETNNDN